MPAPGEEIETQTERIQQFQKNLEVATQNFQYLERDAGVKEPNWSALYYTLEPFIKDLESLVKNFRSLVAHPITAENLLEIAINLLKNAQALLKKITDEHGADIKPLIRRHRFSRPIEKKELETAKANHQDSPTSEAEQHPPTPNKSETTRVPARRATVKNAAFNAMTTQYLLIDCTHHVGNSLRDEDPELLRVLQARMQNAEEGEENKKLYALLKQAHDSLMSAHEHQRQVVNEILHRLGVPILTPHVTPQQPSATTAVTDRSISIVEQAPFNEMPTKYLLICCAHHVGNSLRDENPELLRVLQARMQNAEEGEENKKLYALLKQARDSLMSAHEHQRQVVNEILHRLGVPILTPQVTPQQPSATTAVTELAQAAAAQTRGMTTTDAPQSLEMQIHQHRLSFHRNGPNTNRVFLYNEDGKECLYPNFLFEEQTTKLPNGNNVHKMIGSKPEIFISSSSPITDFRMSFGDPEESNENMTEVSTACGGSVRVLMNFNRKGEQRYIIMLSNVGSQKTICCMPNHNKPKISPANDHQGPWLYYSYGIISQETLRSDAAASAPHQLETSSARPVDDGARALQTANRYGFLIPPRRTPEQTSHANTQEKYKAKPH